jgi:drug/metabolite transporter (DMT)-like permease
MLLLAAVWGGSFLFMRTAAPEFGPVALISLRVGIAAVILVAIVVWQGKFNTLIAAYKKLLLLGVINSCVPFLCFAFAALTLPAGVASILNATAPLWAGVIGAVWLKEQLSSPRIVGLGVAFVGVIVLIFGQGRLVATGAAASTKLSDQIWAVLACLFATFLYGIASNFTKKYLQGTDATVNAAGSQLSSAIFLIPFVGFFWPDKMPSAAAWWSTILLAVFSTALAYLLFFRLISRIGASRTVSVTFLIPVFGCLFGVIFLKETMNLTMLVGAAVVLVGTALAIGLWPKPEAKSESTPRSAR